jgi:molybdate transport system regulatory protein
VATDQQTLELTIERFWLQSPAAAHRHLQLLEAIAQSGSISRGAKTLRISYKTAWSLLETMNNLSPKPLVERTVGGRSGGGTQLTAPGRALLQDLRQGATHYGNLLRGGVPSSIQRQATDCLPLPIPKHPAWIPGLLAPNQFLATVHSLETHPAQLQATLELAPGQTIVSCGARGAFTSRLRVAGCSVVAHINPSAIVLAVGEGIALSADNQLWGVVKRLRRSPVQCEVALQLPLERVLIALITTVSAERLGLRSGLRVMACFSADAVTLLST